MSRDKPEDLLVRTVTGIDWNAHIAAFAASKRFVAVIADCNFRLAVWARELVSADKDNPAISFIYEMQQAGFFVAAATAVALYKPAAGAIRTVGETALYYSYFRSHLAELTTLSRATNFFVTKSEILDFHKKHSVRYQKCGKALDQPNRFQTWYAQMSAIVHGQVPGTWGKLVGLSDIKPDADLLEKVAQAFQEGVGNVRDFLLLTSGGDLWGRFGSESKKILLEGLSDKTCLALGLDRA